jgi:hypothetical protein
MTGFDDHIKLALQNVIKGATIVPSGVDIVTEGEPDNDQDGDYEDDDEDEATLAEDIDQQAAQDEDVMVELQGE